MGRSVAYDALTMPWVRRVFDQIRSGLEFEVVQDLPLMKLDGS